MNLPNSASPSSHRPNGNALTPQEAALRGASLAFQKQQQGSNAATGSAGRISRQATGSSIRSQRDYADEAADRERDRERKALFLSPATPEQQTGRGASSSGQHSLLRPGLTEGKSASFIAATLAASRSASPGMAGLYNTMGAEHNSGGGGGPVRRSPMLREPVDLRRGSSADDRTDTTSLAPATSLISLFEKRREPVGEVGETMVNPDRPVKKKPKSRSSPKPQLSNGNHEGELERESAMSRSKPVPRPKPRIDVDPVNSNRPPTRRSRSASPQPQAQRVAEDLQEDNEFMSRPKPSRKTQPNTVTKAETPPPVVRSAHTVIVSPKPRRPETKPRLEAHTPPSEVHDAFHISAAEKKSDAKPKDPKPKTLESSLNASPQPTEGGVEALHRRRPSTPAKSPVVSVKSRPPAPRKKSGLSVRLSPELKRRNRQRRSVVASHDGQEESKLREGLETADIRPSTSDSISSNDSFVSASSVLTTRDETDSLLTVEAPSTRSLTPKAPLSRPTSTQPATVLPMRRSFTGSSQLPLDSLSDAIMAGSLASARHTPISLHDTRTPPPLPPSRRKGGTTKKQKSSSRRPSPHRMKQTMRQPKSLSDDEDARRPHHKKGLNYKKHAHHEGSRSRWREEITQREKKRYEAVWASNRGALLVATAQTLSCSDPQNHPASHQRPRKPLRSESHEELSEVVANVVVRDIWSRSRLPQPELAEVWDLVYGHGRVAAGTGPGPGVIHGALSKQEFVVGMWLIDQRLRGRKIPPKIGESVWDSAKGLRVLNPDVVYGHHKGKGKVK